MFDIYTEVALFMPWINATIMSMGGMQACDIKLDVEEPKGLISSLLGWVPTRMDLVLLPSDISFYLRSCDRCLLVWLGVLGQLQPTMCWRGENLIVAFVTFSFMKFYTKTDPEQIKRLLRGPKWRKWSNMHELTDRITALLHCRVWWVLFSSLS